MSRFTSYRWGIALALISLALGAHSYEETSVPKSPPSGIAGELHRFSGDPPLSALDEQFLRSSVPLDLAQTLRERVRKSGRTDSTTSDPVMNLPPPVLAFLGRLEASIRGMRESPLLGYFHIKNAYAIALLEMDDPTQQHWMRVRQQMYEHVEPLTCAMPSEGERPPLFIEAEKVLERDLVPALMSRLGQWWRRIEPLDAALIEAATQRAVNAMTPAQRKLQEVIDSNPRAASTADWCRYELDRISTALAAPAADRALLVRQYLYDLLTNPEQFESEDDLAAEKALARSGDADPRLRLSSGSELSYPKIARMLGIEATVVVGVKVDADGDLDTWFVKKRSIRLPGPSDLPPLIFERLFDSDALATAELRTYPQRRDRNGRPIAYDAEFEVVWKLAN